MEKTFSMIYRETKASLVNIINNSKLPPDALLSMMEGMVLEIKAQADMAYTNDLKAYQSALKQEAEKQETSKIDETL